MSSAHRSSTPSSTTAEGAKLAGQEPGSRGHQRRRTRPQGIGRRLADRSVALEARLAQERRRLAADVHDLIMQDVSFALARTRAIVGDPELAGRHAEEAVAAAERALAGARAIVSGLVDREQRPIAETLEESVRLAARGVGLDFAISVPGGARPDRETTDVLIHIAREAATNAVKHAAPHLISVVFTHEDEWCLRVSDDGRGFDPAAIARGFGLDSIASRVGALGGSLSLESIIGEGTTVEVALP
jgi:signal transduction histidine kinase